MSDFIITAPLDPEEQKAISPDDALQRLKEGNERFVTGNRLPRDHGLELQATAAAQYPYAVILGCIDSRVPHEIIFDAGIGDLFSVRIAGNIVNEDVLGSIEFATAVAGSKLVVVLGHSNCGAVKGACDDVHLGHLTGLLAHVRPSVRDVTDVPGERSSANPEFVQAVADRNVERTTEEVATQSKVIRDLLNDGRVKVVGAMHDLSTGRVRFFE